MPAVGIFAALTALVLTFLPVSPFQGVISTIAEIPYLQYLNWFFPVTECIAVLQVWLLAVATYYVYSAILRWIKAIG